ncbi:MAG: glycosyltransferase family 2 protein [Clostridia bacterium]|nr:glycosyltransferase family 2 protein [Clostridia bacterium]
MNTQKIFLSFIVPVYNVEEYLGECLDSLVNQDVSHDEYEIICIDDGSTDKSGEILDLYAEKYTNIVVVHKENGGVSSARNYGIDIAKGKYIWFVDSDDFVRENCLRELKRLSIENYDILNFGGYAFDQELNAEEKELLKNNRLKANKTYWGYSTFRVYKKSIILENEIKFNNRIIYGEDEMFNNDVIEHSERTFLLDHTNYLYRKNPNSAMNNLLVFENQIKRLESVILSMVILKNGIESGKYKSGFAKEFLQARYELVQYCFKRLSIKIAAKYFKEMKTTGLFNLTKLEGLNLPGEYTLKKIYLIQHFKIWKRAYYKKTRSRLKKLLPAPIVRIIKKVLKITD